MNIVTANQNKSIIDRLQIDIIKRVDGEYDLKELLSKFVNLYFKNIIIDITSIKNYDNIETISNLTKAIEPSRIILLLNDNPTVNSKLYRSQLVKLGIYNFTNTYEGLVYLVDHPNTYDDVKYLLLSDEEEKQEEAMLEEQKVEQNVTSKLGGRVVIGLSNLTNHAGATSLTNMMVRQLNNAGYFAVGFEMYKQDLIFFHDDEHYFSIMSTTELQNKLRVYDKANCIIIDLNDFGDADKYCDYIVYLVEPSYLMLTKLLRKNKNAFLDHKNDIVVLNKSLVNEQEVPDFEYETKAKIFANIPPVNDRNTDIPEIDAFLEKFGFNK